jgi:hypothetical protein
MKKNNKKNLHDQKVREAHHRNEYLIRVRNLLNEVGMGPVYTKLSPKILDFIYRCRGQFIKLKAAEENPHESCITKQIESIIYNWCRLQKIPNVIENFSMGLIDFYEIWYTLVLTVKALQRTEMEKIYHTDPMVFTLFDKYINFDNEVFINQIDTIKKELSETLTIFTLLGCHLSSVLYWLEQLDDEKYESIRLRHTVILHEVKAEIINFKFDNIIRPAYRVGVSLTNVGILWTKLTPRVWGSTDSNADIPMDVYIQSHAIKRMQERITGLPEQFCILHLHISIIKNPVVIVHNKNFLIEYRIDDLKIGYVLANVQKDRLIVRTFLFITSNGTPEGQKLSEITGMGKLDKKYLAIDKLSSFLASDIRKNAQVADVFSRAGCGDLLELERIMPYVLNEHESDFNSERMLKYLNLVEPETTPKKEPRTKSQDQDRRN